MKILFLDILGDDPALYRSIETIIYRGAAFPERTRISGGLKPGELTRVVAYKGVFPEPKGFDGVIISGSAMNSVKGEEKPWMKKTYAYIRRLIRADLPILGICGGLQFTARALGEEVVYNKHGRNMGTDKTELTPAGQKDPLFHGVSKGFLAQVSHRCIVKKIQPSWRLLAKSAKSPYAAFSIGDKIRLVQFHPEIPPTVMRRMARQRRPALEAEGRVRRGEMGAFLAAIHDPKRDGRRILRNFIRSFIAPR